MIHITPIAANRIKAMLEQRKTPLPGGGLRISVEHGGCSGMQYHLSFDARKPDDQAFDENGASILVDPASLAYVDGSTIDFSNELSSTGFKVNNPKAKQTCGCGTSFKT